MTMRTLAYDDLPPGSDMRREQSPDGQTIRITVPAGEPPPTMVRQTRFDALLSATPVSVILIVFAMAIFETALRRNQVSGPSRTWAAVIFWVFCAALAALIAWVRYGLLLDALRAARQQQTLIAVTPQRLLVETSGPFGDASHDVTPDDIGNLVIVPRGIIPDGRLRGRRVSYLVIVSCDPRRGPAILPGRDVVELRWVAGAISRVMGVPTPLENGAESQRTERSQR